MCLPIVNSGTALHFQWPNPSVKLTLRGMLCKAGDLNRCPTPRHTEP